MVAPSLIERHWETITLVPGQANLMNGDLPTQLILGHVVPVALQGLAGDQGDADAAIGTGIGKGGERIFRLEVAAVAVAGVDEGGTVPSGRVSVSR